MFFPLLNVGHNIQDGSLNMHCGQVIDEEINPSIELSFSCHILPGPNDVNPLAALWAAIVAAPECKEALVCCHDYDFKTVTVT